MWKTEDDKVLLEGRECTITISLKEEELDVADKILTRMLGVIRLAQMKNERQREIEKVLKKK